MTIILIMNVGKIKIFWICHLIPFSIIKDFKVQVNGQTVLAITIIL